MPHKQQILDLSRFPSRGGLQFVSLTLYRDPDIPLALVRYTLDGVEPPYGLRVDLDKQVFLDHFDDPDHESFARQTAPKLVELVFETVYDGNGGRSLAAGSTGD